MTKETVSNTITNKHEQMGFSHGYIMYNTFPEIAPDSHDVDGYHAPELL
jgi:hypothetical protein